MDRQTNRRGQLCYLDLEMSHVVVSTEVDLEVTALDFNFTHFNIHAYP